MDFKKKTATKLNLIDRASAPKNGLTPQNMLEPGASMVHLSTPCGSPVDDPANVVNLVNPLVKLIIIG
jgi:hypothetical protein